MTKELTLTKDNKLMGVLHTYLKSQVVGVAVVNGVVNVLDADDRNDGAKGLLPCNAHVLHTPPLRLTANHSGAFSFHKLQFGVWSQL